MARAEASPGVAVKVLVEEDSHHTANFLHSLVSDKWNMASLDLGYEMAHRFLRSHGRELAQALRGHPRTVGRQKTRERSSSSFWDFTQKP